MQTYVIFISQVPITRAGLQTCESGGAGDEIVQTPFRENYRIGSIVTIDLTTAEKVSEEALQTTSVHEPTGIYATSETEFHGDVNYSSALFGDFQYLNYHMKGNDDAFFWGVTPGFLGDIDVKINLRFEIVTLSNVYEQKIWKVTGEVTGDRFPSNETYLTDLRGNKLFLGVSGVNSKLLLDPQRELPGRGNEKMSKFNFQIVFAKDGTFESIILNNGVSMAWQDWNEAFTNLDPTNTSTGTEVNNDGINSEYGGD